jgi:hypothetical protein
MNFIYKILSPNCGLLYSISNTLDMFSVPKTNEKLKANSNGLGAYYNINLKLKWQPSNVLLLTSDINIHVYIHTLSSKG